MNWPDKRDRVPLPIDDKLPEILALLKEHPVLICEAETGAGKTTRIAQAALLDNPTLKVWMTQPRRNACRWIGKRIASELGSKPGQLVGWRLLGEKPVFSKATRLELMIDQSLINRIRDDPTLPAGLIIIDEAHERSLAIDFLLALIKEKLPRSPETRVIVTSATIDTQKFSDFFNNAPVLSIPGRCFPVSVDVFQLSRGEHHTEGAIRAAKQIFQQFLQQELFMSDGDKDKISVSKGTVLLLLPGKEDIAAAVSALKEEVAQHAAVDCIEILSCHGESSAQEQDQVQTPVPHNTLRFVCCTELLRTSVTLPETIGVIDSLQVKRLMINTHGIASLEKVDISKAEANQAKGRAGRTAPGFYMPVSFENQYHELTPWPQPAILRESLTHLILQIAAINHSARSFALIDRPSIEKIEPAITRLKTLGALTHTETITENGNLLLAFPLPPELAMILLTASRLNVLAEAVIVTAALDIEAFFQAAKKDSTIIIDEALLNLILGSSEKKKILASWVRRRGGDLEVQCGHPEFPHKTGAKWLSDTLRQEWAGRSNSDFTAIVRAYRATQLADKQFTGTHKAREHYLHNWCFARGINYKKYQLVEQKIAQLQEALRASPLRLDKTKVADEFDETALSKAILSGKLDHIAEYRHSSFLSKLGEFNLEYASACPPDTELVLVQSLRRIHLKGRRGYDPTYELIASYAAPIDPSWLTEIAPQLCSTVPTGDIAYDVHQDAVRETQCHYFNETIQLGTERVIVSPEKAPPVLAQWLAERCLPNRMMITIPNPLLEEVIRKNTAIQTLAHELNERAGQLLFKVYSLDDLVNQWGSLLTGSNSFGTLASLAIFYLPELDPGLRAQVHLDCPDSIRYMGYTLPLHYQGKAPPKSKIRESQIMENWITCLEHCPQLPNGRRIDVEVDRAPHRTIMIRWIGEDGHADLSRINPSSIRFIQESRLTAYLSTIQQRQTVPWFLSEEACENTLELNKALNRFLLYTIEPIQLKFIHWSIAMQVITQATRTGNTILLSALAAHPFMKKRDYVTLADTMSSALDSVFSFFAQRPTNPAHSQHASTLDIDSFIQEAIRSISLRAHTSTTTRTSKIPGHF